MGAWHWIFLDDFGRSPTFFTADTIPEDGSRHRASDAGAAKATMDRLSTLPTELILTIFEDLQAGELAALLCTNHRLHSFVTAREGHFASLICSEHHRRIQSLLDTLNCEGRIDMVRTLMNYSCEFGPPFRDVLCHATWAPPEEIFADHFCSNRKAREGDAGVALRSTIAKLAWLLWCLNRYHAPDLTWLQRFVIWQAFSLGDQRRHFSSKTAFVQFATAQLNLAPPEGVENLYDAAKNGVMFFQPTQEESVRLRADKRPKTFAAWKNSEHERLEDVVVSLHGGLIPTFIKAEQSTLRLCLALDKPGARARLHRCKAEGSFMRPLLAAAIMEVSDICHAAKAWN
ncbi:hypothetical protein LTR17_012033 [Elasticomyces elasticus]|nr:hypothetical protein LTR17_012033 [Elasticomyces elasticus]